MENLFLDLQSDKKFRRQVALLRFVANGEQPMTTVALSEHLQCSGATTREDIESLQYELKDFIQLEASFRGEVIFSKDEHVSLESLITTLAKQTIVYQLIDSMFHQKGWSAEQAAMELATSKTTLLRIIRHMNKTLARFSISIQTSTLDFVGKETDIRIFLFAFYSYFCDSTIICKDAEDIARCMITEGLKQLLTPLHFSHFRVAIWLSIFAVRWHYHFFIEDASELEPYIYNKEELAAVAALFRKFYHEYSVTGSLPDAETTWLYFAILHGISYSDGANGDISLVYRREEFPEAVAEVRAFLTQVFPRAEIADGTVDKLEALLLNTRLLTKLSPSFEMVAPMLKEMIQTMHKDMFSTWQTLLQASQFSFTHIEDVAINLTMLHSAIFQQQQTKQKHVIFSFQGESGFDEYLSSVAQMLITDYIKADFYLERSVTKEVFHQKSIDLVVCNYDLSLQKEGGYPIIRIANIPTQTDWGLVRDAMIG